MSDQTGDTLYKDIFGSAGEDVFQGLTEPDRAEGTIGLLPRFNHYVVTIEAAEPRIAESGMPGIHFGMRIAKGPKGTVRHVVFDDLWLAVQPTTKDRKTGEEIDKRQITLEDPENPGTMITAYAKAVRELRKTMLRLRAQARLVVAAPLAFDEGSLRQWGQQFIGKRVVIAVTIEKGREYGGRKFDDRNRVIWRSFADPAGMVLDKANRKPTGETYEQAADREIAAFDAKTAGGGGKSKGSTAGGFGDAGPTSFFGG